MRIGIDARFLGPGGTGIGRYTQKLIENLEKIDGSTTLTTSGSTHSITTQGRLERSREATSSPQARNEYVIFLRKENFNLYHPVNTNFHKALADIPWYGVKEQILLPTIFGKEKLDLLHVPHFNVPIFYRGKFVITIHDLIKNEWGGTEATTRGPLEYRVKRLGYNFVIRCAVRRARAIITPSNYVKERVVELFHVASKKVVVTYEAGMLGGKERTAGERKIKDVLGKFRITKPYFLYVGNVYPYKNVGRLLEAIKILNEDPSISLRVNPSISLRINPSTRSTLTQGRTEQSRSATSLRVKKPVQLVLVGARDVFRERLKREIVEKDALKYVVLTGYISDPDLVDLYQGAEAYVQPSLSEGFGLTSVEAMSLGTPVVEANASCLPEVAGDAALFFDPYDPKDIAEKLDKVLGNRALRQRLAKRGLARAKKFSWRWMVQQTLKVYEEAVS